MQGRVRAFPRYGDRRIAKLQAHLAGTRAHELAQVSCPEEA